MTGSPASRALRVLVAALAVLAFLVMGAGTSLAHDEVVGTTPASEASVASPPAAVELQLSAPPQALGTEVRVTAPDGALVSAGAPEVRDSTVRQPLADGLRAGVYTVEWRVTSGDGHPITGSSVFTVAQAAPSSATPSAAEEAAPDELDAGTTVAETSAAQPAQSSSSTGLLVGGAVVVLALAGLVAWRLRRQA